MSSFYLLHQQLQAQVFILHATHTIHQSHDEKTDDLRTTQYLPAIKRGIACSMKLFSFEVVLYFYKSPIPPYIEYCCYAWVGALNYNLSMME